MKKVKFYDTLVISNDLVKLCKATDIEEVVGNDGYILKLDDVDISQADNDDFVCAGDTLTEYDFEEGLYIEDDIGDIVITDDYQTKKYFKLDWGDCETYMELTTEHGINHSTYGFDVDDIHEIDEIYMSDGYDAQIYPKQEFACCYKVITSDGDTFFIKQTDPFFLDEFDYEYELITEDEFNEYDN